MSRTDTRQVVDLGGQTIRVEHRPGHEGEVPLLLCNGIGANLELWAPLLEHLDRPTITFDAPGVGGSSVPPYPPTMRGIAALVSQLLHHLDISEVDVLGLSWGGALAQELARRDPQVRRLVLVSTTAGWIAVPGRLPVLVRMVHPRRYRDPEYLRQVAGLLYGGEVRDHPEWLRQHGHQRYVRQAGTRGYVWQLLAGRRWTSWWALPGLSPPTLVLCGDDDPIIPLVNARILARRIPNARLHIVRDGGHLFLLIRAAEYGPMITNFLGTNDPTTPS